jgi:glycosyltransferase involved in cell wall biosynthesis
MQTWSRWSVDCVVVGDGRDAPHVTAAARDPQAGAPWAYTRTRYRGSDDVERDVSQVEQWRRSVSGAEKQELPRRARAVPFPIGCEEPVGTAVREVRAAGTPVVAMARGCLPSLVEDCVTGFLAKDKARLTTALAPLDELEPSGGAATARRRFLSAIMAQGCERNNNEVISRSAEVAGATRHDGQAVERLVS